MLRFRLILLLTCLVLAACTPPRQLVTREFEPSAFMVEDIAHGIDRDVDALLSSTTSQGQLAIASWLHSEIRNDNLTAYPPQIAQRRKRWAVIASGIKHGSVEIFPSGKLKLAADIEPEERRIYAQVLTDENRDRDRCDSILLSISNLDTFTRKAAEWMHVLRRVRHQLDQEYAK